MRKILLLLFVAGIGTASMVAAEVPIDSSRSKITVHVSKSGLFSSLGHNHEIAAPIESGSIDADARIASFHIKTEKMMVLDPGSSESERAKIRAVMLSEQVLDSHRYPEITFSSTNIEPRQNDSLVEGTLKLHGAQRTVRFPVTYSNGHYTGSTHIKQTDFGITPIKVFGGSVSVHDALDVTFDIYPTDNR
ncbi:YceI family protein [Edaphobacter bradus]|uniref:YceI family protein n=1 Tax=Edaphobacter bradus TaxID=2259016 RepID=UPI0021DF6419|nr:YceI family protein [Edaphobacter bradus]